MRLEPPLDTGVHISLDPGLALLDHDDQLAAGSAGLQRAMRLADLLEAEHARGGRVQAAAQQLERVEDRTVADEVEHRVDPSRIRAALRQPRPLTLDDAFDPADLRRL